MSSHTEEILYTPQPRKWGAAWKALKQLMATPEDTTQVFRIMKSLAGNSLFNEFKKFRSTEAGAHILNERISLFDTLTNREYLAQLPEGSLGKTYYDFCQREGISPEGLVEASQEEYEGFEDKNLEFYANRTRESHDLWHVISGYGRDGLGEVCVVAFSYAQTKSLGFAAIAVMGAYKFKGDYPDSNIWSTMWQAYRNGKKAEWLPGIEWEKLMDKPLTEVREILNIKTPAKYQKLDHVIAGTRPEALAAS